MDIETHEIDDKELKYDLAVALGVEENSVDAYKATYEKGKQFGCVKVTGTSHAAKFLILRAVGAIVLIEDNFREHTSVITSVRKKKNTVKREQRKSKDRYNLGPAVEVILKHPQMVCDRMARIEAVVSMGLACLPQRSPR